MVFIMVLTLLTIVEGFPPYIEAEAKFSSSDSELKVSGTIIFSETHDNESFVYTRLSGSTSGITWTINTLPCFSKQVNPSFYDPFDSDISANTNVSVTLSPFIRDSVGIVGRSVTLGKDTGEKACADILWRGPELTQTITELDHNLIYGTIVLWQVTGTNMDENSEYPTIIYFEFEYFNDTLTTSQDHDWHIHKKIVDGSGNADCMNAGSIIGLLGTTDCSFATPEFCASGDMGSKFGHINIPGQSVFIDRNLPFPNGAAFVIHQANSNDPRLACEFLSTDSTDVKLEDFSKLSAPSESSNAGVIAGAVIGGLVGAVILAVVLYCIITNVDCESKPKTAKTPKQKPTSVPMSEPEQDQYSGDAQAPAKGAVLEGGKWRAVS